MAKGSAAPPPTPVVTSAPASPAVSAPTGSAGAANACPYRQATLLQQALSPDKMRVAFFLGAGCPVSIRVPDGTGTRPLIPNIEGLTDNIRASMNASVTHKLPFDTILKQLDDSTSNKRTIEDVLTRVRGLFDVVGASTFEGMSKDTLSKLDKAICEEIHKIVKARLPARSTPYHQLAAWIGSIPRAHPVEVFTSNYDLLMEQAFEESSVPYFDGFSGSDRTFFDDASMEQDKLPARWARLWKVHGSINWWRTEKGAFQRREKGDPDASQMIHPSHLKYEQSRMMPYLAMQDRLRSFLARGQSVLVTCGYSFMDYHLNRAILQGLAGNPTAVCFGLLFGDRALAMSALESVGYRGNLRLLGVDGGLLGTVDRNWHSTPILDHELHESSIAVGNLGARTSAPDDRCKFLLGDFRTLGAFLAEQLDRRGRDDGDARVA